MPKETPVHLPAVRGWLLRILSRATSPAPRQFSGLGLVVYRPPIDLPVAPLFRDIEPPELPLTDENDIASLLQEISSASNTFHDGFHLLNGSELALTHVSQFFSPPIPRVLPPGNIDGSGGARQMAATLGSLLPSVLVTAVVRHPGEAVLVERGETRSFKLPFRVSADV